MAYKKTDTTRVMPDDPRAIISCAVFACLVVAGFFALVHTCVLIAAVIA